MSSFQNLQVTGLLALIRTADQIVSKMPDKQCQESETRIIEAHTLLKAAAILARNIYLDPIVEATS